MIFRAITLQEANTFLPLIKERFAKIHKLVAEGQLLHETLANRTQAEAATNASEGLQNVAATAADPTDRYAQRRLDEIEDQIKDQVFDLQQFGAVVKSVFPARVDFLSERHKQHVYLCWQMGDKTVSHWHPLDEGFSTRRPIGAPQAFGPTVIH